MVSILAFIGLIAILWWLSKSLKKVGTWLTAKGLELAEYQANKKIEQNKILRQHNTKVAESIQNIKGDAPNVLFREEIRREIKQLERDINLSK